MERGERIELLVDKTDNLNQQAFAFKKRSTQLKRAMWWKNTQLMVMIVLLCFVSEHFQMKKDGVGFAAYILEVKWIMWKII